ncbi:MAG: CARDB domain-containing protein, partial [Chthoniobacteraceae bacterium]
PLTVLLQPSADLVVTSVTAPATMTAGQTTTVSWTVQNQGAIPTNVDRWVDSVYLSNKPTLGEAGSNPVRVFAAPNFGTLAPNQSYTQSATFTLPPSATGSYIIVKTNEDPGILTGQMDTDLAAQVTAIIQRAEAAFGRPLSEVSLAEVRALSPGQLRQILTGPDQAAPQLVFEGSFTQNNERSAPTTVVNIPPDIVVTAVSVTPQTFSGESITVTWTVTNRGSAPVFAGTKQWDDWVLFGTTPAQPFDTMQPLGSATHISTSPLLPGESYTQTATFTIPAGIEGTRYVTVVTDPRVSFSNGFHISVEPLGPGSFASWAGQFQQRVWEGELKRNNVSAPASFNVVYREADLFMTSATASVAAVDSSGSMTVSVAVQNTGTRTTRSDQWWDYVFLTRDGAIDSSAKIVGAKLHRGTLDPGASYSATIDVTIPDNIGGQFVLVAFANAPFADDSQPGVFPGAVRQSGALLNEYRNLSPNSLAIPVTVRQVPLPDLQVTSLTAPDRALQGRGFSVSWTVTNTGAGPVPVLQGKWTDRVYLSRDQFLDVSSDQFIASVDHVGVLAAGQNYSVTQNYSLPRGITGPYYVFVITDAPDSSRTRGLVVEANDNNNATVSVVPMLISLPPPADLIVASVTGPTAAQVGSTLTLNITVTNRGTESAIGSWTDAFYLSADSIWDLGDRQLGTVGSPFGGRNIAPGQSYTATVTVRLPATLPGTYRIIGRADVFDDVNESNQANNIAISTDALTVIVPILTLGVNSTGSLPNHGELLYQITVPAGLTLQTALTASGGANELYIRRGALPSSLDSDAAYAGALQANQMAVLPTTQAATYFVLVRSQGGPDPAQITLLASALPFGITNVSPDDVGAGRYATVTITGAQFSPQATVKLIRPQFGEYVPVNFSVVDATRIVAVFDFRNAPLGLYDVQVANPDGSTAIVPYRLLVSQAKALDATIGLGGPDEIALSKAGFSNGYYAVSLLSLTNVDTPYVFIQYGAARVQNSSGVIPGERISYESNLQGSANVSGVPWVDLQSTVNRNGILTSSGFAYDFNAKGFGSLTFSIEVYPQLKALLAQDPSFLQRLSDDDLARLKFQFPIFAAATPMTSAEYVAFQRQRASDLRDRLLSDSATPQSIRNAAADLTSFTQSYLNALQTAGVLRAEDVPPASSTSAAFRSDLVEYVAGLLGGDAGAPVIASAQGDFSGFYALIRKWSGETPTAYGGQSALDGSPYNLRLSSPTRFESFVIKVTVPGDFFSSGSGDEGGASGAPGTPNPGSIFNVSGTRSPSVTLTGPSGYGTSNIVPAGYDLPFTITFANPATAGTSGAVRTLQVATQIDANLDPRTFQLGPIRIGDLTLPIPSGRGAFSGEFDFTADRGYRLQVVAGIDVTSGVAIWNVRAIDGVTGEVLPIGSTGLLRAGQSAVFSYTVRATSLATDGSAIATGTVVSAQARVIADGGVPVDTNRITATLDLTAPVSALTVTQGAGNVYTLTWSAQDDAQGSGVRDYNVFFSNDGQNYSPLLLRTTGTRTTYQGDASANVRFLVLATDNAGNAEQAPPGLSIPIFNPGINLGTLPLGPPTNLEPVTTAPPPTTTSANSLFVSAQSGVPSALTSSRVPSYSRVIDPF